MTDLECATRHYWEFRTIAQREIRLGLFVAAQKTINTMAACRRLVVEHGLDKLAAMFVKAEQDLLTALAVAEGIYPARQA